VLAEGGFDQGKIIVRISSLVALYFFTVSSGFFDPTLRGQRNS
jgi:hypothetical protein